MKHASDKVVRFGIRDRLQHLFVLVDFFLLAVTGIPQKFHTSAVSRAIVNTLGGIGHVRVIHRVAGVCFSLLVVAHVVVLAARVLKGKSTLAMVPGGKDVRDMIATIRYYLGAEKKPPAFDRFDYKEKFEYWGIVLGGFVMISTGVGLMFPVQATMLIPGQLLAAARLAHGNEALMAFLVVVIWHIYNVVLSPEVFPGNTTMFTGKISRERMRHEHALEYERTFPDDAGKDHGNDEKGSPEPKTGG